MSVTPNEDAMVAIRQFRLREWDWDGSGGLPLRHDVADTASDLYAFPFAHRAAPTITSMNGDGTVDVEYESKGGRKLFLTFHCSGIISYIKVFEDDQTTIEGVVRIPDGCEVRAAYAEAKELFRWLESE